MAIENNPTLLKNAELPLTKEPTLYPEDWDRATYMYEYGGDTPLLSILESTQMGTVETDQVKWTEQEEETQSGYVEKVLTEAGVAYDGTGVKGTRLKVFIDEDDLNGVIQHNVLTFVDPITKKLLHGAVQHVEQAGAANSYALCKLLVADSGTVLDYTGDAWPAAHNSVAPTWLLSNDARREMSELPEATSTVPTIFENQTQISMGSIEMTGTELARLKRADVLEWGRQVAMGLQRLQVKRQRNLFFGVHDTEWIGGKPLRRSRGIREALDTYHPENVIDYRTASGMDWSGKTWRAGGMDFLDWLSEQIVRYYRGQGIEIYLGNRAFTRLNQIIRDYGWQTIETNQSKFGFKVHEVVGFHTDLRLIRFPDFSRIWGSVFHDSMCVLPTRFYRCCSLVNNDHDRSLKFINGDTSDEANVSNASAWDFVDGRKVGWLCEDTLKWNNLRSTFWIDNVGQTNVSS